MKTKSLKSSVQTKAKVGRKSGYPRLNHSHLELLYKKGCTDKEVSAFLKITTETLRNYKNAHPKFFASIQDWKDNADDQVEHSLHQRAIGYLYKETTEEPRIVKLTDKKNKNVKRGLVITKVVHKQIAPDVSAQKFWLTNRRKKQWKDRIEVGTDGQPLVKMGDIIIKGKVAKFDVGGDK